jgi:hypothetical protein
MCYVITAVVVEVMNTTITAYLLQSLLTYYKGREKNLFSTSQFSKDWRNWWSTNDIWSSSVLLFWAVTPCELVGIYRRFVGTYCFHLLDWIRRHETKIEKFEMKFGSTVRQGDRQNWWRTGNKLTMVIGFHGGRQIKDLVICNSEFEVFKVRIIPKVYIKFWRFVITRTTAQPINRHKRGHTTFNVSGR